jgi:serine/threonine protein kinase
VDESPSAVATAQERGTGARYLGRYLDLGEIASGGMASVHFGKLTGHAGFAREVAIKRLHPHLATDPEFVAMLLDEARLAGRIVHANVVPTLDVVVDGTEVVVVMEYVRGLTLSQLFKIVAARGERMPPRIANGIIVGVLYGLHAAHEATDERGAPLEIVHRDVSPHNILVGIDGVARLLDFGIAKAAGRLQTTQDGRVKGKIAYMSPEQVQGGRVTRRADIYSTAVVLWEAVTGERLYQGENDASIVLHVITGDVRPPSRVVPQLPLGIDEVVLKATARNAVNRYATARDMAIELERHVPSASASEIAHWATQVGYEALRERGARITELERALAESEPANGPVSVERRRVGVEAGGTPSVRSVRTLTPAGAVQARSELSTIADVPTPSSTAAAVAAQDVIVVVPRRRSTAIAIALMAAVTTMVLATIALRMGRPRLADPAPSVGASVTEAPPALTVVPAAAETHGAPVAVESAPPPSARPVATSASSPPSASASPPPPAPTHHVHHAPTPKCIPSTVDSAGHTHFNAACL